MLRCKICKNYYNHLGSHIWHGHHILAKEYKGMFGLPYNMALITEEIKEKKRRAVKMWRTWKKNFKDSKKYQFKRGWSCGYHRTSESEKRAIIKRIKGVNERKRKLSLCPICRVKFYHIESHLFNKHRLLMAKGRSYKQLTS